MLASCDHVFEMSNSVKLAAFLSDSMLEKTDLHVAQCQNRIRKHSKSAEERKIAVMISP